MSEGINPNVSTANIAEPVQQVGGNDPVSFDDLDTIDTSQKETKEVKDKSDEKDSKQEAKTKETKEVKDSKETKRSKEAPNEKDASKQSLWKSLKIKNGDTELDITPDALVPVKIAGKIEMVPIQEALNNYSSQSQRDREYSQLRKDRDSFQKERSTLSEGLSQMMTLLSQKDVRGAVEYLSEVSGVDPHETWKSLRDQIATAHEEVSKLSPEERIQKEQAQEIEYYRKQDQLRREKQVAEKTMTQEKAHMDSLMQQNALEGPAVVQAYDELVKMGYDKNTITPETVVNYAVNIQKIDKIESIMKEVSPDLENFDKELESVAKTAIQMKLNDAEIQEVIKELYGNQAERKLAKKVSKLQQKSQAEIGGKRDTRSDPSFFDDLG